MMLPLLFVGAIGLATPSLTPTPRQPDDTLQLAKRAKKKKRKRRKIERPPAPEETPGTGESADDANAAAPPGADGGTDSAEGEAPSPADRTPGDEFGSEGDATTPEVADEVLYPEEDPSPEPAAGGAVPLTPEEVRRQKIARALNRRVDPLTEPPSGRVMVYAVGEMTAFEAQRLEQAVVMELFKRDDLKPIAGSVAKLDMTELSPECQETGGCMAQLARSLDANLVITCEFVTIDDLLILRMQLMDLNRAEMIAHGAMALDESQATDDMIGPTVEAMFSSVRIAPPLSPHGAHHAHGGSSAPPGVAGAGNAATREVENADMQVTEAAAQGGGWSIRSRVPFALSVVGLVLGVGGTTTGAVLLAVDGNSFNDVAYLFLLSSSGFVATMGLVATIIMGLLTDWDYDEESDVAMVPLPVESGMGAAALFRF